MREIQRMKHTLFSLLAIFTFSISFGQTYLIDEDFQGGIQGTWQVITNDTSTAHPDVSEFTSAWIIKENPDTTGDSVIAATSYFEHGGVASRWIITPQVQLGTHGNFIEWDAKSHDPSFPDGYHVLISTTNDSLHNFTDTLFYTDFELPNWTTREFQLADSTYAGMQVYFAFVNDSDDQYILYLDNIRVRADDPLSISDYSTQDVSQVFPNPFDHSIFIQTEFEISSIQLTDMTGKIIKNISEETYQIHSLESLPKGMYVLQLNYKNGLTENKKMIKR